MESKKGEIARKNQHLKNQNLQMNISDAKPMPADIEIEKAVLGVMMIERVGTALVLNNLKSPDVFYIESHQMIFSAIRDLFADGNPVDILTVTNALRAKGTLDQCGGAFYITDLTSRISGSENSEFHCRILAELWVKRLLIHVSSINYISAFDETQDAFELLDKSGRQIMKITEHLSSKKAYNGKAIYDATMATIEKARLTPGETGLLDGIQELDKITGGDQETDLIILAARPGMGKTAMLMNKIRYVVTVLKRPVMVFSLEMSAEQLMLRLISAESQISAAKINKGYIDDSELAHIRESTKRLYDDNLIIDDTPALSVMEMRAKSIAAKIKYPNLALIGVDYIQLMTGEGGNREQEISSITRGLKQLAKELKIPVRALSQLSRSVETRGGDKRPQLSDLRESGSIEQDADVVIFLLRQEYYKVESYADGSPTKNTIEVIYAKNRHGPTDHVTIGCTMATMDFYSLDDIKYIKPKEVPHPDKFTQPGNIDAFDNDMVRDEYNKDDRPPF
jgi:replicative DNA helicase